MQDASEPKRGGKQGKRRGRGAVPPRVAPLTEMLRVAAPKGSQFRGYEPYQVQDLVLSARVVRYRRERWLTPSGETLVAPLPEGIRGHFGAELRRGPGHGGTAGQAAAGGGRQHLQAPGDAPADCRAG